jgi:hypothetical protein
MEGTTAGMFNELALIFAAGLIVATVAALLLPYQVGILFVPAGLIIIAASYVAGGGTSIRTPASTPMTMSTTFARVETDIRFGERNVNWNLIFRGALIGTALVIAGLVAFFA